MDGTDSPVSADSSTSSRIVSISRRSAGTREPEVSSTMSPGTSFSLSISRTWPSRMTVARGAARDLSALIARSAFISWKNPITAFSRTTASMTPVSTQSLRKAVIIAAMIRM